MSDTEQEELNGPRRATAGIAGAPASGEDPFKEWDDVEINPDKLDRTIKRALKRAGRLPGESDRDCYLRASGHGPIMNRIITLIITLVAFSASASAAQARCHAIMTTPGYHDGYTSTIDVTIHR